MSPRRFRPARVLPAVLITAVALLGVAVLVVLVLQGPGSLPTKIASIPPATRPTAPDPTLSPAEAVTAVLAALRDNHPDDDGIRTTFRFASPANQAVTGPVDRFITMVKRPPYDALVNHRAASVRPIEADGHHAAMLVTVIDHDGRRVHYVWILSKQTDGLQKDCWMTDAVSPARPPPDEREDEERA